MIKSATPVVNRLNIFAFVIQINAMARRLPARTSGRTGGNAVS
jgi:hypothetical protein